MSVNYLIFPTLFPLDFLSFCTPHVSLPFFSFLSYISHHFSTSSFLLFFLSFSTLSPPLFKYFKCCKRKISSEFKLIKPRGKHGFPCNLSLKMMKMREFSLNSNPQLGLPSSSLSSLTTAGAAFIRAHFLGWFVPATCFESDPVPQAKLKLFWRCWSQN